MRTKIMAIAKPQRLYRRQRQWTQSSQPACSRDGIPIRPVAATVIGLTQLQKGTIESTVSATGTCNAVVDVQVGSQVSGNIKALYADFNTRVKAGQLVAE
jgi:multidrug efflux pump subunit AcrA (membrane-fusion protein)